MSASVESLLTRLSAVERRLAEHASAPLPAGTTEPDPDGEERWEAGQVWAHLAEFPAYWLHQAQRVIAQPTHEPVPFGRVKTDAGRARWPRCDQRRSSRGRTAPARGSAGR